MKMTTIGKFTKDVNNVTLKPAQKDTLMRFAEVRIKSQMLKGYNVHMVTQAADKGQVHVQIIVDIKGAVLPLATCFIGARGKLFIDENRTLYAH